MAVENPEKPEQPTPEERIAKAQRELKLMPQAAATFDPIVLSSSIDAIARVLINAGLCEEAELKALQRECQAQVLEALVQAARGGLAKQRPTLVS